MNTVTMPIREKGPAATEVNLLQEFGSHMDDWIDRLSACVDKVLEGNGFIPRVKTEEPLPIEKKRVA